MAVTKKTVGVKKTAGTPKAAVKKTTAVKPVPKKGAAVKKAAPKPAAKKAVAVKKTVAAKKPAAVKATPKPKAPAGLSEQMLEAALRVLDERQADEIVTIPLAGRSSVADYILIASGRAGRQIAAIADHLRHAFYNLGVRQVRVEGLAEANWVLVDAGDIIIHLFRPEVRVYYGLDRMLTEKPQK